jgi:hypothetical protein
MAILLDYTGLFFEIFLLGNPTFKFWIRHSMEAKLLHRVCYVRSCYREVLKRAGHAAVVEAVADRFAIRREGFGLPRRACSCSLALMSDAVTVSTLARDRWHHTANMMSDG